MSDFVFGSKMNYYPPNQFEEFEHNEKKGICPVYRIAFHVFIYTYLYTYILYRHKISHVWLSDRPKRIPFGYSVAILIENWVRVRGGEDKKYFRGVGRGRQKRRNK